LGTPSQKVGTAPRIPQRSSRRFEAPRLSQGARGFGPACLTQIGSIDRTSLVVLLLSLEESVHSSRTMGPVDPWNRAQRPREDAKDLGALDHHIC
jgi:hypothetical protein